ncbi:Fluoroacetyl-CoA thioesterase [Azospirillaceae bacterium]
MKDSLKPGQVSELQFRIPRNKTVPFLYPESPEFAAMPEVFATGFMVGLIEWACLEALRPHLDPGEGSLGTGIAVSHVAATPPGMTVVVTVTCKAVEGRRIHWSIIARDEQDVIGEGEHTRTVVTWERFLTRVAEKAAAVEEVETMVELEIGVG